MNFVVWFPSLRLYREIDSNLAYVNLKQYSPKNFFYSNEMKIGELNNFVDSHLTKSSETKKNLSPKSGCEY